MTRTASRLTAVLSVALAGLLASCGAVPSSSDAFSIDGASYSREDINSLLKAISALQELTINNGLAPANEVASVVSAMAQYKAGAAVLERWGEPLPEAERKKAEAQLSSTLPADIPDTMKQLLVDINITGRAVGAVKIPPRVEIRSMYEAAPASTGHMCIRQITVKDEKAARAVVDAVSAGGDFASLATKNGTENGGVLEGGNGSNCVSISTLNTLIGPRAVGALLDAPVGRPTEAFEDEEGWHVAVHRPYSEIETDLLNALSSNTGQHLTYGLLATADVRVNSVYGTWNRVTARVE